MTPFVLDDGPFMLVARQLNVAWAWPASRLNVVREVAAGAADRSPQRREIRQRALALASADGPAIAVHDLMVGGQAAGYLYNHLRRDAANATLDIGEDASIALCAVQMPAGVFVSMDQCATLIALGELGKGRVASAFDVWDELRNEGLISLADFNTFCQSTLRQNKGLPGVPRRFLP